MIQRVIILEKVNRRSRIDGVGWTKLIQGRSPLTSGHSVVPGWMLVRMTGRGTNEEFARIQIFLEGFHTSSRLLSENESNIQVCWCTQSVLQIWQWIL